VKRDTIKTNDVSTVKYKKDKKIKWSSAYMYLIPWVIGLAVFRFFPFVQAFYISLQERRIGRPPRFVGFDNYVELFTGVAHGELFRQSLGITFRYVFLTVPLVLVFALFIAFILNFKIKGIGFFRTAFYIPSILGGSVSVAILWRFTFGNNGLINSVLGVFGIPTIGWLTDPNLILVMLALLRAWQFGSVMLIFLSALQNVPLSLYEAARVDGAGRWRQFFTITVPIITPVILFNTIQLLVAAFQEFNGPFLITHEANMFGPGNSAMLLNIFIYQRSFAMSQFGIGAAASWVMFVIIMIFTMIIFKSSRKWVFYND
jgi:oligogalacturonide transport system permease protein